MSSFEVPTAGPYLYSQAMRYPGIQDYLETLLTVLFFFDLLGVPISWHKAKGGLQVAWVGYQLCAEFGSLAVGISDKKVNKASKEAAVVERERRQRMEEKQKKYNEVFKVKEGDGLQQLVLDFDEKTEEAKVEVDPLLAKKLKPHQGGGIKFMWDAVFESKKDVKKRRVPGGGILAHCMGLGKTLQTITLTHTIMDNPKESVFIYLVFAVCRCRQNF